MQRSPELSKMMGYIPLRSGMIKKAMQIMVCFTVRIRVLEKRVGWVHVYRDQNGAGNVILYGNENYTLNKQDRKIIDSFGVGEDTVENTMETNENKQLDHQTIQSRFFI